MKVPPIVPIFNQLWLPRRRPKYEPEVGEKMKQEEVRQSNQEAECLVDIEA